MKFHVVVESQHRGVFVDQELVNGVLAQMPSFHEQENRIRIISCMDSSLGNIHAFLTISYVTKIVQIGWETASLYRSDVDCNRVVIDMRYGSIMLDKGVRF